MPETFLILLAGGIMLAAGVSDPRQVTLQWLRLAGILALAMGALSAFFLWRGLEQVSLSDAVSNAIFLGAVLGQLAFVQIAWRRTQQVFAWLAFFYAIYLGTGYLRPDDAAALDPWRELVAPAASAIGVAAMTGVALMEMLLGHAYLTASKMTIHPLRRLNIILAGALLWRAMFAIAGTSITQAYAPVHMLWGMYGLYIITRWIVGLVIPAVFIYMTHDCIARRSTQSATGILYVTGVLIFIGEILAVYLVRQTGLPF